MDLFLAHAYQDEEYASGLEDDLAGRGLVIGESLSLWPGQRPLPQIDQRLHDSLHAIVVFSREFLKFSWTRKELDGLATRSQVVAILSDIGESEVARHTPRLAIAAFPVTLKERLVRLISPGDVTWKVNPSLTRGTQLFIVKTSRDPVTNRPFADAQDPIRGRC